MTLVDHATGELIEPLSAIEKKRLTHAEVTIQNGLESFVEVGEALNEVREGRLYREGFGTFEKYCQKRWGLSRAVAYNTIEAAEVVARLSSMEDTPKPVNVRQARELFGLTPEVAAEVMVEAQAAPKVTATAIREARERIAPRTVPTLPREEPTRSYDNGAITWRRTYMDEIRKSARLIVVPPEDVIKNADHALLTELFRAVDDINNYADRVRALVPTGLTVIKGDAK